MGESHTLFRLTIFIGFVLLMSSVLATPWVYVGQPLPANSPWGQFSSGIQNFPQFDNPFSAHSFAVPLEPTTTNVTYWGGVPTFTNHFGVVGCSNATYWDCINTNDGNTSYVILKNAEYFVNSNFTFFNNPGQIVSVSMVVRCRASTDVELAIFHFDGGLSENNSLPRCPVGNDFGTISVNFQGVQSYAWDALIGCTAGMSLCDAMNTGFAGLTARNPTGAEIDITYMRLDVYVTQATVCQSGGFFGDTACQIGRFFDTIVKAIQFFFNGILFVFGVLFWFVGMVGIFFGALMSILSIPGAPPIISGLIGILIIGSLFFVAIVIMGKIRGTGNTG